MWSVLEDRSLVSFGKQWKARSSCLIDTTTFEPSGMESASTIRAVARSVTVICSTDEPLPAFAKEVGAGIRKVRTKNTECKCEDTKKNLFFQFFESKDVKILTKTRISSLEGDSNGAVSEVRLVGGKSIPAQIVIAGIGW